MATARKQPRFRCLLLQSVRCFEADAGHRTASRRRCCRARCGTRPWRSAVVTVAADTSPVAPKTAAPLDGRSRAALAREIQTELKRVGCYGGAIDGSWGTASKRAMVAFIERVNASLPLNEPDDILLLLVKSHTPGTCGISCPVGQSLSQNNRCVPDAILAHAGKQIRPAPELSQNHTCGLGRIAPDGCSQSPAGIASSTCARWLAASRSHEHRRARPGSDGGSAGRHSPPRRRHPSWRTRLRATARRAVSARLKSASKAARRSPRCPIPIWRPSRRASRARKRLTAQPARTAMPGRTVIGRSSICSSIRWAAYNTGGPCAGLGPAGLAQYPGEECV